MPYLTILFLVLGVMGCTETTGADGQGGDGGTAGTTGQEFPCTEQGIHDAIAEGGGPHFFACIGPTAIEALFTIDNDVVLDGEDELETDAIEVLAGVTAELRGFHIRDQSLQADHTGVRNDGQLRLTNCTVAGFDGGGVYNAGTLVFANGLVTDNWHVGIWNDGTMNIVDSSVSGNANGADSDGMGAGIHNTGALAVNNSTVAGNRDDGLRGSGGIYNAGGFATLTNSTVSGNDLGGAGSVVNEGTLEIAHSTVSGGAGGDAELANEGMATMRNSLIDGDCGGEITTIGHNIESPGDTCGLDTNKSDLVNVSADDLKLEPLLDNGGPTETRALGAGSVAIDRVPAEECVDADGEALTTDQRGEPRDSMCDVGAFEVQR